MRSTYSTMSKATISKNEAVRRVVALSKEEWLDGAMPTKKQLQGLEEFELADAIAHHGGQRKIARLAGLSKFHRSSPQEIDTIASEFAVFVAEKGAIDSETGRKVCPTYDDLEKWGKTELVNRLKRIGGLPLVAEKVGLNYGSKRPRKWLYAFDRLKDGILEVSKLVQNEGEPMRMPLTREFAEHNSRLLYAIQVHGGFKTVAHKLDLPILSKSSTSKFDNFLEFRDALKDAMIEHQWGPANVMPTQVQLQASGRHDLVLGVNHFGGFRAVARVLRLKVPKRPHRLRDSHASRRRLYREWDELKQELESFVEISGKGYGETTSDATSSSMVLVMPSLRELHRAGRDDIRLSISWFHGGLKKVADRMGWCVSEKIEKPTARPVYSHENK